ncbi:hypothetical protein RQP53_05660 [Paucibacter sp. APW11]|uniref:MSHA biogenesis protein MshI n=1 Tax=Roseateles aquae TaxID=3077235 RepID=A0ABU3P9I9_9BURK|nr:hypothetical protein [Paucibacter sp. APW11]MDT8998753.1 hypothetical protein [Paucibacter sp. APW11]
MRWPWQTRANSLRLSLRMTPELFAYVLGEPGAALRSWGAIWRGGDSEDDFNRRIKALGLQAGEVQALLEPPDYQILKVDSPKVPAAEMKAAARWQIKEMVEHKLEELTLDVLHVGIDVHRGQPQMFVIAAQNSALRQLNERAGALQLGLDIADIWETALRNLQSAQAKHDGLGERACAALLWRDGEPCLLCICAEGELYYTRRLDSDARLLARAIQSDKPAASLEAGLSFEAPPTDANGIVDYSSGGEESALVIELQRSIDVWERSTPDLPLARLYVVAAEHAEPLAALLQRELGLRSSALQLGEIFSGLQAGDAQQQLELAACLPLLGASLRDSGKEL